jgi:serine/threonine-protein kinase
VISRERWTRVKELFFAARDLGVAEREVLLDRECGGDAAMRDQIAALLSADEGESDFLQPPGESDLRDVMEEPAEPAVGVGDRVGPYELTELIARGGMGEVYLARRADEAFNKQVAVKVLHRALATPRSLRRFRQERQVLAKLDHPNVTRLLDGGTTPQGVPYLVMEYVEGSPIDRWCDDQQLPVPKRLALFREVCAAVQYAHRNLVVHGDIKPANVLVARDGTVKLVDFGISRLLESDDEAAGRTRTAVRAMTPEYASPEQVRGEPLTTAADVYSLGVVLYELLCGRRPHELGGCPAYEADRAICEETPSPPSTAVSRAAGTTTADAHVSTSIIAQRRHESPRRLRRLLAGDLDTIVLTALQKDAARRYGSVEQLAEDVRRHLEGHPVRARRDTFGYRAVKFLRRNRLQVAAALAVGLAVAAAMAGVWAGSVRARQALRVAEAERNAAIDAKAEAQEVLGFFQQMLVSSNPYRSGRPTTVLELIVDAEHRIERELAGKPAVEAGVRLAIARSYASLMTWPPVAAHLERALPLYRQTQGADAPAVAECLALLGRAYSHRGRPEAVQLQREGLAIRRALYGDRHPLVAESIGNLGFALWSSQKPPRWAEAERCYREALQRYESLGLAGSRDSARFTMSLGYMYAQQQRPADAEEMYVRALALYDHLPVTEDLYELAALCSYATVLTAQDRYAEATAMLERARALIPDDFHLRRRCDVIWNIGKVELARRNVDRAERELREALALECEIVGQAVPASAEALAARAELLRGDGPPAEALLGALETIDTAAPRFLDGIPRRVEDLAKLLAARGDGDASRALLAKFGRKAPARGTVNEPAGASPDVA